MFLYKALFLRKSTLKVRQIHVHLINNKNLLQILLYTTIIICIREQLNNCEQLNNQFTLFLIRQVVLLYMTSGVTFLIICYLMR